MEYSRRGGRCPMLPGSMWKLQKKGEVFFMDVPLAKDEVKDAVEEEHMKCISLEEKYELWLIRKE
jgi:hypothetical protein